MGLSILSKKAINSEDILSDITIASVEANLSLYISENAKSRNGRIELEIKKAYEQEEYLSIDILPKKEQIQQNTPDLLQITYQQQDYFVIAGTSDAYFEHIIYDLSLSYLRLNPDNIISIYNEILITLDSINKIEAKMGYYTGWMKEI
ncbi:MAG: hypothetical protein ACWA41_05810 [Putridiphycobacter sp.]